MKNFRVFTMGEHHNVFFGSELVASFKTEFAANTAADQLNRTLETMVESFVGAKQA